MPLRSLARGHLPRSPTRWGPAGLRPRGSAATPAPPPRSPPRRRPRRSHRCPGRPVSAPRGQPPPPPPPAPGASRQEAAATGRAGEAPSRDPRPGGPGDRRLLAGRERAESVPGGVGGGKNPPVDRWREESGQLTRAVAPAHGAGEQKGACEQTGSGSGRSDGPRRPRAAPRGTHRGEGGRATWRPGAPAPRGSREQRRGEQLGSAQRSVPTPPRAAVPWPSPPPCPGASAELHSRRPPPRPL